MLRDAITFPRLGEGFLSVEVLPYQDLTHAVLAMGRLQDNVIKITSLMQSRCRGWVNALCTLLQKSRKNIGINKKRSLPRNGIAWDH